MNPLAAGFGNKGVKQRHSHSMNAFADSFDYVDIVKRGRRIRDLARAYITKTNNLK